MTVLNLMLGKKRGGLEQAALDYAESLALAGVPSLTIASPGAWIEPQLAAAQVPYESLASRGNWDVFAARHLRAIAKRTNATAIICHGNRAISIALRALKGRVPVIAVAHNYSTRRFNKADACFAITQHLQKHLAAQGASHISVMPNMVRLPDAPPRGPFRSPPILGSMGRFVEKKGFKLFIESLALLRARGIEFRAILGGDGEEADAIRELITRYHLEDTVKLIGWVQNKPAFFESLDIFVLPSLMEAFGIALIEALSYGMPVISTEAFGPREILHHEEDGILVKNGDREAMAEAMEKLIRDHAFAAALGRKGAQLVAREYTMQAMADRLKNALITLI